MTDWDCFLSETGITQEQMDIICEDESYAAHESCKDLFLSDDSIAGLGLFSNRSYLAGDLIGVGRVGDDRTIIGRYSNHSKTPNAQAGNGLNIVAIKDIARNQEITTDYAHTINVRQTAGDL